MENIIVACVFLVVATFVVIFFKPSKITNYPSLGKTIVMFGDSLTVGVGASEGHSIRELISKKIKEEVLGMGVSGQTSGQGLQRIDAVIALKPKVTLVLFGGNDYLKKVEKEITFKNIDTIVQKLQRAGSVVILIGIQGGILSDPFHDEFKRIAKKRGAVYVTNVLENIIGKEDLMSDQVHPNDNGCEIIASRIAPILKKVL